MNKLISFAVILLMPILFISCHSNVNKPIRIGYLPLTANMPLFVAVENGYFEEENIDITLIKYETSNQMLEALVTNRIDIETATSASVTVTVAQTLSDEIKVFMLNVFDEENYLSSIVIPTNSPIKNVQDLKNKMIGTYPGSTMKLYTSQYLKECGVEYKEIIPISPSAQLSALSSGSIDAILTLEPTGSLAKVNKLGQLLVKAPVETKVLFPWVGGTNSFSSDFYNRNPQLAEKIIAVFNKSVDWIREHPDAAKKTLSKYTAIQDSSVYSIIPVPVYWKLDEIKVDDFQKMVDHLLLHGDIDRKVNVNDIILKHE